MVAELREDGGLAGRGSAIIYPERVPGKLQVPVVEPRCEGDGCPDRYTLNLRIEGPGRVTLGGSGPDPGALSLVVAEDDGLRVDVVENVVGYRRLNALPRIRWAGRARVIGEMGERLRALAAGVGSDEVILSRPGPKGAGLPADIRVLEDGGDVLRVAVSAPGAGYLVVADPLLPGWVASVDRRPAALRAADHGVAAVFVPAGAHQVVLRHDPPGWRTGLAVSALSAAILLVAVAFVLVRRRASTRATPRAMLSGVMTSRGRATR
jgi:hypothetical protein